jgi:hypothetical protein
VHFAMTQAEINGQAASNLIKRVVKLTEKLDHANDLDEIYYSKNKQILKVAKKELNFFADFSNFLSQLDSNENEILEKNNKLRDKW